jgi:hypothetical protein
VQEASTSGVTAGEEGCCYRAIGRNGDESFSASKHLVLSIVTGTKLRSPLINLLLVRDASERL